MLTVERLTDLLADHGGVLARGKHAGGDGCPLCVLELVALAKLGRVTDDPRATGYPNIRAINDAYRCDTRRTRAAKGCA